MGIAETLQPRMWKNMASAEICHAEQNVSQQVRYTIYDCRAVKCSLTVLFRSQRSSSSIHCLGLVKQLNVKSCVMGAKPYLRSTRHHCSSYCSNTAAASTKGINISGSNLKTPACFSHVLHKRTNTHTPIALMNVYNERQRSSTDRRVARQH